MDAIRLKDDEEVLKELCDLVYVCVGMCVSLWMGFWCCI